jgi:hypothetical protein
MMRVVKTLDRDGRKGRRRLRIVHSASGTTVAEGTVGWNIVPFDGGWYIRRRCLRSGHFRPNYLPGLCPYKGIYVGLNYHLPDGTVERGLGWTYILPNPLLPFLWFRTALPRSDPSLVCMEDRGEGIGSSETQAPSSPG